MNGHVLYGRGERLGNLFGNWLIMLGVSVCYCDVTYYDILF